MVKLTLIAIRGMSDEEVVYGYEKDRSNRALYLQVANERTVARVCAIFGESAGVVYHRILLGGALAFEDDKVVSLFENARKRARKDRTQVPNIPKFVSDLDHEGIKLLRKLRDRWQFCFNKGYVRTTFPWTDPEDKQVLAYEASTYIEFWEEFTTGWGTIPVGWTLQTIFCMVKSWSLGVEVDAAKRA